MKPYALVLHNRIRLTLLSLRVPGLKICGIHMFGRNLKLCFHKSARIILGDRIISDGRMVIIVGEGAELRIGNGVYFNEDAMISCKGSVKIGDGCKFGPNVKIFDNNHRFDAANGVTDQHNAGDIFIGENCWIGANVVILKDTKIGKNCVIGAGCVVSGVIPEKSIVTQGRDLSIQPMKG